MRALVFVTVLLPAITALADNASQTWRTDYVEAYKHARSDGKWLLVWFTNDELTDSERRFARLFHDASLQDSLGGFVCVQVAKSTSVEIQGKSVWLLGHPSFAEMLRLPGLAILDLRDRKSEHYGDLVSVCPFRHGKSIDPTKLKVLLGLPVGTLTQRTLIFAIRTHPESPQSTRGVFDPLLAGESTKHSLHQASITLQGHHNWDRRFQLISARLPDRLLAQEVCAESWPGQNLVEAAEECVDSWRQSSGHWSAVKAAHPRYGYDMKRGRNGVWYATGIFGKR